MVARQCRPRSNPSRADALGRFVGAAAVVIPRGAQAQAQAQSVRSASSRREVSGTIRRSPATLRGCRSPRLWSAPTRRPAAAGAGRVLPRRRSADLALHAAPRRCSMTARRSPRPRRCILERAPRSLPRSAPIECRRRRRHGVIRPRGLPAAGRVRSTIVCARVARRTGAVRRIVGSPSSRRRSWRRCASGGVSSAGGPAPMIARVSIRVGARDPRPDRKRPGRARVLARCAEPRALRRGRRVEVKVVTLPRVQLLS